MTKRRINKLAKLIVREEERRATDDDAWVAPLRGKVPAKKLVPMSWRDAEAAFLERFRELRGGAS